MFGRKTRDLIVETATIVRRVDRSLVDHNKDNEEKFKGIHNLIKDCHDSCPEASHIKDQNGTLVRMEKKYDAFYEDHAKIKGTLAGIKTAKKTGREILSTCLIYITIIGIVLGSSFGYLRYKASYDKTENKKIEKMLEKILEK